MEWARDVNAGESGFTFLASPWCLPSIDPTLGARDGLALENGIVGFALEGGDHGVGSVLGEQGPSSSQNWVRQAI